MKKLINYICLVITLTFFFITNVYAYGCKSSPIDLETAPGGECLYAFISDTGCTKRQ